MISAVMEERNINDWSKVLPTVEYGLRTAAHKTTKYSPYEVIFGRKPRLQFFDIAKNNDSVKISYDHFIFNLQCEMKLIHEKVLKTLEIMNHRRAEKFDRTRWNKKLNVGDRVMVRNEQQDGFGEKFIGPFIIISIKNDWTYILRSEKCQKVIQRNYNQIKYIPQDDKNDKATSQSTSIQTRKEISKPVSRKRYPTRSTRNPNPRYN